MPRTRRLTHPGAFHHVFNRSLNQRQIFTQDRDYEKFLDKLEDLLKELDFILYSYVLLPTHFHILIETGKTPLSKIMSRLLTSYAVYFNKKHQGRGPIFEERYKSRLVQKDAYFLALSRYIHLNPVKAGLAKDPALYPYSSFSEIIDRSPPRLIAKEKVVRLIGDSDYSLKSYQEFVYAGIKLDLAEHDPWLKPKTIIGSARFTTNRFKKYA